MRMRNWLVGLATLAASIPSLAQAQVERGEWTLTLRGGPVMYAEASAIELGTGVAVEALYYVSPRFAIGPVGDYVHSKTDGRYFIGVMNFGPDSTHVYEVGQSIGVLQYGAAGLFDLMPENNIAPYLAAGAGGYTIYLQPTSNDMPKRSRGMLLQAGGGVRFTLGDATAIQLDVRDLIYMDFDRDELNPVRPAHRNRQADGTIRFPGAEHDLPEATSTVHNIRVSIGFRYIPGRN